MCPFHVLAVCVHFMCWQYVSISCVGSMCPFHVLAVCVGSMCWQYVSISPHGQATNTFTVRGGGNNNLSNGFRRIQHIFTNTHKEKALFLSEVKRLGQEKILYYLYVFFNGKWQVCGSYNTAIQVSMLIFLNKTKLWYASRLLVIWRTFVELSVDVWVPDRRRVSLLCKTRRQEFHWVWTTGGPRRSPLPCSWIWTDARFIFNIDPELKLYAFWHSIKLI